MTTTQANNTVKLLIGIDDTDNLESRGTGFHARSIGAAMEEQSWGRCDVITRHQLLVSPLVPFTSHNSAACITVTTQAQHIAEIEAFCRRYLLDQSAEGSDAGLCIGLQHQFTTALHQFGFLCKRRVVTQGQARQMAEDADILLEGLTGTHDGIIGALAAASLNASGSDGRMLWLKGMRERADSVVSLEEILSDTGIDTVQTIDGEVLSDLSERVAMGSWPRAIWLGGEATILVEPSQESGYEWKVAAKEFLRQF
jgi:hypothetical protein